MLAFEMRNEVDEWAARADRRKLARITHQDQACGDRQRVDKCGELILGQHRGFIDDAGGDTFRGRGLGIGEVASGPSVVTLVFF